MIDYLKELADLHGESYATHFIREWTSVGIRMKRKEKLSYLYCTQVRKSMKHFVMKEEGKL